MDYSKITNSASRAALEAWQKGDSIRFLSYFKVEPEMTDNGNSGDFYGFVKRACGLEKFLSIDSVGNDGTRIAGNFKAGQWGICPVFFKFGQNAEGKFERLDIGRA